ncbi:MAG: hypothetical protein Q9226_006313, partial [Calogaya cf. arnoldii]
MASANGDHSLVSMLLQAGVDPTIEDNLGWRAKDHAAFRGWLPIAKELSQLAADQLEKGDEVNSIEQQRRHNVKSELSINFAERLKRQRSADECEVFVNLGALDTYKPVLGVDLSPYVKPDPYTPQREADYTVEVRAINGDQTRHLVQLPILEDRANKPWRFVTKHPEDFKLAFTIYHSATSAQNGDSPIGTAVALLRSLKQGCGPARESLIRNFTIPILHKDNLDFIGTVTFYCLIVTPFPHPDPKKVIQRELPCLGEDGLPVIGHRGMGQNDPGLRHLQLGENTIESFKSAQDSGASYVEFDVQLTKDDVPIIYHDFLMSETGIDAPLHNLNLEQIMFICQAQSPEGDPSSRAERNNLGRNSDSSMAAKYRQRSHSLDTQEQTKARGLIERMQHTFEYKLNEHKGFDSYKGNIRSQYIQAPFATLEELFTKLPESIGFDIEIKYPMLFEAHDWRMETFAVEVNHLVDNVLDRVYRLANDRTIAGVDAGDDEDCLALLIEYPHNGQFDSNACPDYATCSASGDDYLSELLLIFLYPNNVDREDRGPIFRRHYKVELLPLTQQGASISADLSVKGINLLAILLVSTSSRTNPNPWLEYFNIFDTNNGIIIGISNWWSHDYMHTLSWSELVYQTWKETSEQQSKGAATLFA